MSRPIRLLRIARVKNDRLGGMSRMMYETGDYLQTMGFDVRYLFEDSFSDRIARKFWRFTNPWESLMLIRRHFRQYGPCDLVELHEPLTIGTALFKRILFPAAKVIGFSHGVEHRSWPLDVEYAIRYGSPLRTLSRITGSFQAWQSLMGLRLCDHVVCTNTEDTRYLAGLGIPHRQLTVNPNGVGASLIDAGRGLLRHSSNNILYVGTWIHRKGIRELIPAIQRLIQEHRDVRLTIAGCRVSEQEILHQFDEASRPSVQVIPAINSDAELAALYAKNDIFVLPSHFEGQPLVMMEAAAFGLAILTTGICGMRDFIRSGENGLLIVPGDASDLYAQLKRLVINPDLRVRLGSAARADVAGFTWEKSAQNLARAYRSLVSR